MILSGLLRYLFVAAGCPGRGCAQPLFPSLRRQAICVVQISALTLAIVPGDPAAAQHAMAAAALAALAYSFLVDTLWLWRSAA